MTREEAILTELRRCGGWPYGVRAVYVDERCRVWFDDVMMSGFLDSYTDKIQSPTYWLHVLKITKGDFERKKAP